MSKTTILVACAFAGAIILGTTTTAPADPGNGIPARVSALESALADQADELSELSDLVETLATKLTEHDHDADYVRAPAEDLSIVKAVVVASGRVINGKGFTVTRSDEENGEYEIEFDEGTFSSQPAVYVQAIGSVPEIAYIGLPVTADGFRVLISTGENHGFKFIAIGGQ